MRPISKEECQLNFLEINIRGASRAAIASAIAISLTASAFAEDAARHRTPRRLVSGSILQTLQRTAISRATATDPNQQQGPGGGAIGPGPGCNLIPAPPSVGANVGLSYFGPSPSSVNRSLV